MSSCFSEVLRCARCQPYDSVPAVFISKTEVECTTPRRHAVHTAQVTATNGDGAWSGQPLVYIQGSGTFLNFIYDNSNPGCLGCNHRGFQAGAAVAERVRERW